MATSRINYVVWGQRTGIRCTVEHKEVALEWAGPNEEVYEHVLRSEYKKIRGKEPNGSTSDK